MFEDMKATVRELTQSFENDYRARQPGSVAAVLFEALEEIKNGMRRLESLPNVNPVLISEFHESANHCLEQIRDQFVFLGLTDDDVDAVTLFTDAQDLNRQIGAQLFSTEPAPTPNIQSTNLANSNVEPVKAPSFILPPPSEPASELVLLPDDDAGLATFPRQAGTAEEISHPSRFVYEFSGRAPWASFGRYTTELITGVAATRYLKQALNYRRRRAIVDALNEDSHHNVRTGFDMRRRFAAPGPEQSETTLNLKTHLTGHDLDPEHGKADLTFFHTDNKYHYSFANPPGSLTSPLLTSRTGKTTVYAFQKKKKTLVAQKAVDPEDGEIYRLHTFNDPNKRSRLASPIESVKNYWQPGRTGADNDPNKRSGFPSLRETFKNYWLPRRARADSLPPFEPEKGARFDAYPTPEIRKYRRLETNSPDNKGDLLSHLVGKYDEVVLVPSSTPPNAAPPNRSITQQLPVPDEGRDLAARLAAAAEWRRAQTADNILPNRPEKNNPQLNYLMAALEREARHQEKRWFERKPFKGFSRYFRGKASSRAASENQDTPRSTQSSSAPSMINDLVPPPILKENLEEWIQGHGVSINLSANVAARSTDGPLQSASQAPAVNDDVTSPVAEHRVSELDRKVFWDMTQSIMGNGGVEESDVMSTHFDMAFRKLEKSFVPIIPQYNSLKNDLLDDYLRKNGVGLDKGKALPLEFIAHQMNEIIRASRSSANASGQAAPSLAKADAATEQLFNRPPAQNIESTVLQPLVEPSAQLSSPEKVTRAASVANDNFEGLFASLGTWPDQLLAPSSSNATEGHPCHVSTVEVPWPN
ncbi:MAG TPA: hypothetical protein VM532_09550 [Burkholderiales bacterium]|nr:hypothetical protein [Burkholderiales bacterium]